ncbi:hypothetical protein HPB50_003804 [Hyalomma asiaticum]|uniref:Uncharacterized protein n=1 Tax=Hyalomma asiaticum TaxID=266040 RepID=A0ACB7S4G8_HYAAI|nr:hypothetical protein HPB50_003804 [Hyalomma asiaticum]
MKTPFMDAEAFSKGADRIGEGAAERAYRAVPSPPEHSGSMKKRSILHSRFHIKLIATYLTPILLLPLFVFHNTPKTRCAYVMVLVFVNWVTRTLPLGVTALMPLLYLPALRIISYDQVVGMYMNNTVLLTLAAIMMSIAIETTNLHTRIALWVLLQCGQSLRNIMAGYTVATFLITLLLKNSATLDIMVPVVDATVHEIHYIYMKDMYADRFGANAKKRPSVSYIAKALNMDDIKMRQITTRFIKIRKVLLIMVAYTASLGSVGTLSGTITNYVTKMIVTSRFPKVDSVTFLAWLTAFLPVAFFEVLMAFIVLYFMHMRRLAINFKKEAVHDAFLVKYRSLGNVTTAEKVVMVVLAVVFFLWSTRKAVFFKGWAKWLHMSAVDDTSVAFMAVAVLFAVPMSNDNLQKRILSWSVVKHKMAWGMLLTFGGGLALGVASETEASGDSQEKGDGAAVLAASIKAPDAREEDAKRENIVQATTEACAGGPAKEGLDMECEESATPAVGKRQLEVSEENGKPEASAGEPLPKAQFTRRPTLKIQPKVPPDRRATPPAAKTMPADPP